MPIIGFILCSTKIRLRSAAREVNAINDALAPFGVRVNSQPITPEKLLRALGKI